MMAWLYLIIAGSFEIGWPLGLKLSQTTRHKFLWIIFAIFCICVSTFFLWLSQKTIPMGTAYAVWTGIGAVGAFVVGILLFKDPANAHRVISATFIVIGIIGMKLSHP